MKSVRLYVDWIKLHPVYIVGAVVQAGQHFARNLQR